MPCEVWRGKLAAYADGELSSADATAVGNHLQTCAGCAAVALETVQMKRSIAVAGKAYVPGADFRAKVLRSASTRRPRERQWIWKLILVPAALVLLLSLATSLYMGRGKARERVYSELADLHVSTLASATPVDVISTDRHTVKPWFEGKLPFSFNLPELQGTDFTLIGGRVAYLGQTPGAQLIYRLRKHEISVFIFQDRGEAASWSSAPTSEFSFTVESWNKNGLRYYVIGDVGAADVEALSKLLRNAG
jgi:anti-sigma factor RsiW